MRLTLEPETQIDMRAIRTVALHIRALSDQVYDAFLRPIAFSIGDLSGAILVPKMQHLSQNGTQI